MAALMLAGAELVAAGVVLYWAVDQLYERHSMSMVLFVAGTTAGVCGLLVPGLLVFARGWARWVLQPLPVMFVVLLAALLRDGFIRSARPDQAREWHAGVAGELRLWRQIFGAAARCGAT